MKTKQYRIDFIIEVLEDTETNDIVDFVEAELSGMDGYKIGSVHILRNTDYKPY